MLIHQVLLHQSISGPIRALRSQIGLASPHLRRYGAAGCLIRNCFKTNNAARNKNRDANCFRQFNKPIILRFYYRWRQRNVEFYTLLQFHPGRFAPADRNRQILRSPGEFYRSIRLTDRGVSTGIHNNSRPRRSRQHRLQKGRTIWRC